MQLELFEQLVSDWLDEPAREDLRAAIETAILQVPELGRVRDQFVRMHDLIRAARPMPGVDYERFSGRVASAVDASMDADDAATGLAATLRQLPAIDGRVDWTRLQERISESIAVTETRPRVIRFPWRSGTAAGLAAAAAIAAFVFWPRRGSINPDANGVAIVHVISPDGSVLQPDGSAAALARVSISPAESQPREPIIDEPMVAAVEVVMVIDPPRRGGRSPSSVN